MTTLSQTHQDTIARALHQHFADSIGFGGRSDFDALPASSRRRYQRLAQRALLGADPEFRLRMMQEVIDGHAMNNLEREILQDAIARYDEKLNGGGQ